MNIDVKNNFKNINIYSTNYMHESNTQMHLVYIFEWEVYYMMFPNEDEFLRGKNQRDPIT